MTHRATAITAALLLWATASAETYLTENFANYIPSAFTTVNADGTSVRDGIYKNIGKDMAAAWVAGQLANGYGRAALSPTRKAGGTAADHWMILPPITVNDSRAVLRWEARSMHKHIPETYRVAARRTGDAQWQTLYSCESEDHVFTRHVASLGAFAGSEIEIAFVATTCNGFMLAVDNIYAGVPDDHPVSCQNRTPHFVGEDDHNQVAGTLTYYGVASPWTRLRLTMGDEVLEQPMPPLAAGESIDYAFDIRPLAGETIEYALAAVDAEGAETPVYSDFVSCSHFSRNHIIDRCSGTWCNNCPPMELTVTRLERLYGSQVNFIEAHVNDVLVNREYHDQYLGEHVRSLPALIPNHTPAKTAYTVAAKDDFSSYLAKETVASITITDVKHTGNEVAIATETRFAATTDNTDDRYRVAYMLTGDIHDPDNGYYLQQLSASNYNQEQYYYMPDVVMPEMMYFENVPINATVAMHGVPLSLPATPGHEVSAHTFALEIPPGCPATDIRALAMVIDNHTGEVLNSAMVPVPGLSALPAITIGAEADARAYDITGRPVTANHRGIVIRGDGKKIARNIRTNQ